MTSTPWSGRRLHFVGIGGAGMSGLALVARDLGAAVTGSDRAESVYTARLGAAGIEPVIGHDRSNVPDGAEVVVSTAIAKDNPEVAEAPEVLHRGDLLAQVSELKRCLAVAGTHGKTTTTSMIVHVLIEAGRAPAYLIGGDLRSTGRNADWGDGDRVVVEADESDRSFLKLQPDVAVITNVELDHHSEYHSRREIERAFRDFASAAGSTIAWEAAAVEPVAETYGIGSGDLAAERVELGPGGSRFSALGVELELGVPGEHNVLNALAAIAGCRAAGVAPEGAAAALRSFPGAA